MGDNQKYISLLYQVVWPLLSSTGPILAMLTASTERPVGPLGSGPVRNRKYLSQDVAEYVQLMGDRQI